MRRFNRLVTQRAGALEEHFLGRDRPLGESRILFEIGPGGASLRHLRSTLGLDAGYLSRLVRALEARGLVQTEPDRDDERLRHARLTEAGLGEYAEIDRRSDEAAAAILERLGDGQRRTLVEAMERVHQLLRMSAVEIGPVEPTGPDALWCLDRYFEELDRRFDGGFDVRRSVAADLSEFRPPRGAFFVAKVDGDRVGCGGLTRVGETVAYLKRMWVDGSMRGLGLGRRLLDTLERHAEDIGCRIVQLETNRALREAVRFYRRAGYREVEPFNEEPYAHHWFEKELDA